MLGFLAYGRPMYLFRLHVRPGGGSATMTETFAYCLRQGVLGVGWRIASNRSTSDWDAYFAEAKGVHDSLNVCTYIRKWVNKDDLVWTRDPQGAYYLARVLSGWEYFVTEESVQKDIDIANVFRVEIFPTDIGEVPGKIVASFRASRTIQEVASKTALEYSRFLWNRISGSRLYEPDPQVLSNPDVFALLDSEEVEDIVLLYLQSHRWFAVPSSRRADTLAYEYVVVDPKTGENAQVQVKTGNTVLNQDDYANVRSRVILFQSSGLYVGTPNQNVTCLKRDDIEAFLQSSAAWLPKRILYKVNMGQTVGASQ